MREAAQDEFRARANVLPPRECCGCCGRTWHTAPPISVLKRKRRPWLALSLLALIGGYLLAIFVLLPLLLTGRLG